MGWGGVRVGSISAKVPAPLTQVSLLICCVSAAGARGLPERLQRPMAKPFGPFQGARAQRQGR